MSPYRRSILKCLRSFACLGRECRNVLQERAVSWGGKEVSGLVSGQHCLRSGICKVSFCLTGSRIPPIPACIRFTCCFGGTCLTLRRKQLCRPVHMYSCGSRTVVSTQKWASRGS